MHGTWKIARTSFRVGTHLCPLTVDLLQFALFSKMDDQHKIIHMGFFNVSIYTYQRSATPLG